MSSGTGYHTPIEDEVAGDAGSDLLTSRAGSLMHTQVVVCLSNSLLLSI